LNLSINARAPLQWRCRAAVAIGNALPDMPLFLKPEFYVPAPLESTYEASWNAVPAPVKRLLVPTG
jgi:hypothetical protein